MLLKLSKALQWWLSLNQSNWRLAEDNWIYASDFIKVLSTKVLSVLQGKISIYLLIFRREMTASMINEKYEQSLIHWLTMSVSKLEKYKGFTYELLAYKSKLARFLWIRRLNSESECIQTKFARSKSGKITKFITIIVNLLPIWSRPPRLRNSQNWENYTVYKSNPTYLHCTIWCQLSIYVHFIHL